MRYAHRRVWTVEASTTTIKRSEREAYCLSRSVCRCCCYAVVTIDVVAVFLLFVSYLVSSPPSGSNGIIKLPPKRRQKRTRASFKQGRRRRRQWKDKTDIGEENQRNSRTEHFPGPVFPFSLLLLASDPGDCVVVSLGLGAEGQLQALQPHPEHLRVDIQAPAGAGTAG